MSATRVVVTGLGTTSPVGGDVPSTWAALLAGQSGVRPIKHDWAEQLSTQIAAEVADSPRSTIVEQVANGVTTRMAVLYLLLGGADLGGEIQ